MNEMISISEAMEITGGSEELFRELMQVFIDVSPAQISRIQEAAEIEDLEELREAAHDLKSSASSLAAHPLYESTLQLEQSAKMKLELDELLPMIKEVEKRVSLTIAFYSTIGELHENQQNFDS